MTWWGKFRGWSARRVSRVGLLGSVSSAVFGALVVAALAWVALWWMLGAKTETPNQVDLTKIALSIAAGVGGAVALVVAYRRQRDTEQGRFVERFGAAAKQLGDQDVAVRMAGVFAMAGVADEATTPARRQQCVDVLCGYLRLPYDPDDGANHLVARSDKTINEGSESERKYQFRQNDKEVRHTIVRVIVDHVRPDAEVSWSDCHFHFNGAVLEDAEFGDAVFRGSHVSFLGATFTGYSARFDGTKFHGPHVTFRNAQFLCPAHFTNAEFHSVRTTFAGVTFARQVAFDRANLRGLNADFSKAEFIGSTSFLGVSFGHVHTLFDHSLWRGGLVFDQSEFSGLTVEFWQAEFHGDTTSFSRVAFHSASVSFVGAAFMGKQTNFKRLDIRSNELTFESPRAWHNVAFDWDHDPAARPSALRPTDWPPTVDD